MAQITTIVVKNGEFTAFAFLGLESVCLIKGQEVHLLTNLVAPQTTWIANFVNFTSF